MRHDVRLQRGLTRWKGRVVAGVVNAKVVGKLGRVVETCSDHPRRRPRECDVVKTPDVRLAT